MISEDVLGAALSKFGALVNISIENEKVFHEILFSVSKRLTFAGLAIHDIVIDPLACTCDNLVFLPAVFKAFGAGPIEIDMYFGVTTDSDGTEWGSINRDNTSSNTADVVVKLDPTVTDVGIKLPVEFSIFSDGIAAVSLAGGESKEGLVFNARKDGKYMFRFTNTENAVANSTIAFNWYEV